MNDVAGSKRRGRMKSRRQWAKHRRPSGRPGGGELLTQGELAKALGESERTIQKWRNKGLIPTLVLGHRSLRFSLERVLAVLAKREVKGGRYDGCEKSETQLARHSRVREEDCGLVRNRRDAAETVLQTLQRGHLPEHA